MGKSLFEDMVEFSEKGCEKRSLYSGLYILLLLLNYTHTEQRHIYDYRKILDGAFRDKVNGFRLAVLDLLQLSCLFSPTIIFSKSSGILVYSTE